MSLSHERPVGSAYLRWVKTHPPVRFDLMASGMPGLGAADLPSSPADLAPNGSGPYGYAPLLDALAARYGVPAACVVAAAGTSMANHLALAALLGPGDEVLVEEPTYEPILAVLHYLGATVRRFARRPEDHFRIDPEEVARQLTPRTRLVVLCNLHNPTGAYADDDTLRAVGAAADRVGARVLVDEVYLDARFEARPRTAFHLGETFVTTNSLTKVYGLSGLRCGWVLAAPPLAARMWRLSELFNNTGAHPAERLSVVAVEDLAALAARSRAVLDVNGAALRAFLAARADLDAAPHEGGTVAFPRLRHGRVEALCESLLARYETAVVPGRFFEAPDRFRIGLGSAPDRFAAGLERLGRALDTLPASRS